MAKRCTTGRTTAVASLVAYVIASACAATSPKGPGQASLKDFETRTLDAPFDEVYAAATEALFDLGYTIQHSDKATGVLVGEKRQAKPEAALMALADGLSGQRRPESEYYNVLQLTLFMQAVSPNATKVRIKTAVDKKPMLEKKATNEIWLYIEREVLMEAEPEPEP